MIISQIKYCDKITDMKKKFPDWLKDGLVGLGIGAGTIIPGISGATIALVFKCYQKIVNAVSKLLSKQFLKNLLILLPFGIGAILAVVGLIKPFQLAFEYCMFAIVCLFAAFIIGSFPGLIDNIRGKKTTKANIVALVIAIIVAAMIGILSICFNFNVAVENLFAQTPWYLYLILLGLGIVCASGLTVPGFSASMLLLVIGFYKPILNLVHIDAIKANPGRFFGLIGSFAGGVIIGFFLFSYLMSYLLEKHNQTTHYTIIGFVTGSLIAIFVNSDMFAYINGLSQKEGILQYIDWIIAPFFVAIGIFLAYLLVKYARKSQKENSAETK